jgi:hypothetical protein
VRVHEILPGIFRWTAVHPEIRVRDALIPNTQCAFAIAWTISATRT